ncbi:hypothetical protein BD309DRAFT_995070 [Dichomitus squalens]|uniref:Uncharacterized protein n=1 Tax=Dichomitus squalens TaxID=114155 RepID=A0A4Q9N9K3_9APHY|nr:hypothetical protein BD309DRAFT_995070 [Dichomitus squalens]TBU56315.1 hypothetical protein BD310DRAFT_950179 [Dichomitus squalens]
MSLVDAGAVGTAFNEDYMMDMLVPHLLSGFACMDFLSHLPCDLAIIRGKIGCRPGAFLFYFGCRYLSVLSILSLLAYYDAYRVMRMETLSYICQVASSLSLGFAFSIITTRICALYKNTYLSLALQLVTLVFWGFMFYGLQDFDIVVVPERHVGARVTTCVLMISLSTCGVVLALTYVFVVARREHSFRIHDCFKMLYEADVLEFLTIWVVVLPGNILSILDASQSSESPNVPESTGLKHNLPARPHFVTARIYRKMIYRFQVCPRRDVPLSFYDWFKWGALGLAGRFRMHIHPRTLLGPHQSHELNEHPQSSRRGSTSLHVSVSGHRPAGTPGSGNRACAPANSRTTYAQSSLYDSRIS